MLQAREAELKRQVDRLTDQCTRLDANLYEAKNEIEKLRVKLLQQQPHKLVSDANQPSLQNLQQRITANKVMFYAFFAMLTGTSQYYIHRPLPAFYLGLCWSHCFYDTSQIV